MTRGSTSTTCVECDVVITNPICPECLAERMKVMVQESDPDLAKEIRGMHIEGDTRCIFCNKSMSLCAHCFTMDVYEFLHDKNPELAEEFAGRFDFEIRKALI